MNINLKTDTNLAGIRIPDSKLAREITELVRDTEPGLLFIIQVASITGPLWPASVAGSDSIPSCFMQVRCSTTWA